MQQLLQPLVVFGLISALASAPPAQVAFDYRMNRHLDALADESTGGYGALECNAMVPGDVDGDGDLDLLIATNERPSWIYFNDGDGGFTRRSALPYVGLYHGIRSAALFDADGDGDLDALLGGGRTAYQGPGHVRLYLNDGVGNFTSSLTIPSVWASYTFLTHWVGTADMDADGDTDVVLFTDAGVRYWQNDGTATFTDESATAMSITPSGTGRVADIDGDGDTDILVGQHLLRNDGTGVFQQDLSWSHTFVDLADMDGDGDIDLIASQIHLNDGTGTFSSAGPTITLPQTWPLQQVHAVDIDSDGLLDILGTDHKARPFVLRQTGGFAFTDVTTQWFAPEALIDSTISYSFGCTAAFDIDQDGDIDLFTGGAEGRNSTSTTVGIPPKLFVNSNGQSFEYANRPSFPWKQEIAWGMAVGDIDGDHDVDIWISYQGYGWTSTSGLWLQNAAGEFDEAPSAPLGTATTVALGDVDGDGDLDAFAAGDSGPAYTPTTTQPRLALNDGNGNFTDVTATHLPTMALIGMTSEFVDVDSDGDLDVVVGAFELGWGGGAGAPLVLLRNDGGGVFQHDVNAFAGVTIDAGALAIRDFDDDGDLDVVAGARYRPSTQYAVFLENDGSGTFTDSTATRLPAFGTALYQSGGLAVADLDDDGDLDIATSEGDLRNDGTGHFTLVGTGVGGVTLSAADLDENGVMDRVVARSDSIDTGGQTRRWGYRTDAINGLVADLDDDGDLDAIVTCTLPLGNWDWSKANVGVLYNQKRDLRTVTQPRLGQTWRQALRGSSGDPLNDDTLALLAIAPSTLTAPQPIAGLGNLRLDPAALLVAASVILPDATTSVEIAIPIPNDPAFAGLPLASQALFVPVANAAGAHLSAAFLEVLTP